MIKILSNYTKPIDFKPVQKMAQKRLPILFLSEFETSKTRYSKINSFKSFIRKNLSPEQKIIKDNYSNYDLMNNLYTSNIFIHSNKGYTDSILDCICILLNNQKDAYLLHLAPEKHKNSKDVYCMQKQISSFVDDLRKNNHECNAMVFGGEKGRSEKLADDIIQVLKQKEVEPQEILFDKNDNPHSFYYDIDKGVTVDNYVFFDLNDIKKEFDRVKVF